jgi:uncharacterized protein (TIGR02594 family)
MRFIVWLSFVILIQAGLFAPQARSTPLRSVFAVGHSSCDDRYLYTCDTRGWQPAPEHTPHRHPRIQGEESFRSESSAVLAEARRWMGTNPTGRGRLWCARFMNFVLERTGRNGTGSDLAMSFAHYGRRLSEPQPGAIAVLSRRGGGHVGVVSGIDARGNPIIISGNHGGRVGESAYPRSRVRAYVMP